MAQILINALNTITSKLNELMIAFNDTIILLFNPFQFISKGLFVVLITFQIIVIGYRYTTGAFGTQDLSAFLLKLVFVLLLVNNFSWISSNFLHSISNVFARFRGTREIAELISDLRDNPTVFAETTAKIFFDAVSGQKIDNNIKLDLVWDFKNTLFYFLGLIVLIVVLLLCMFLTLSLFIVQFEFNMVVILSLILVPFMITDYLKDVGSVAIKAMINTGFRVAFYYFMAAISVYSMKKIFASLAMESDASFLIKLSNLLVVLVCAFLLFYIFTEGQKIINTMITGTPSLSGGQLLGTMFRAGAMATGIAAGVSGMAGQGIKQIAQKAATAQGAAASYLKDNPEQSKSQKTMGAIKSGTKAMGSAALNNLSKSLGTGQAHRYGERHQQLSQEVNKK